MVGRPPSCGCGACAKCKRRVYMKKWYQKKSVEERRAWIAKRDRDRVRAYDRARHVGERAAASRGAARRFRDAHPETAKAYAAVKWALQSGKLTKLSCQVCGTNLNVEAHHEDYSKPLEVVWLCPPHHGERHQIL